MIFFIRKQKLEIEFIYFVAMENRRLFNFQLKGLCLWHSSLINKLCMYTWFQYDFDTFLVDTIWDAVDSSMRRLVSD